MQGLHLVEGDGACGMDGCDCDAGLPLLCLLGFVKVRGGKGCRHYCAVAVLAG